MTAFTTLTSFDIHAQVLQLLENCTKGNILSDASLEISISKDRFK